MGALTNQLLDTALLHDLSLTREERGALSHYLKHGVVKFTEVEAGPLLLPAVHAAKLLNMSDELFRDLRVWAETVEIDGDRDRELEIAMQGLRGIVMPTGSRWFSRHSLVMFARGEIAVRLAKLGQGIGNMPRHVAANPVEAAV